ncbi:hypothetical protein QD712_06595 [Streptomyces acidiscabies]|uniref:hypothetical protein n=1 Tax=Streptomyces acidiscabies TaxID=42234 RepID=UPI0030CAF9FB
MRVHLKHALVGLAALGFVLGTQTAAQAQPTTPEATAVAITALRSPYGGVNLYLDGVYAGQVWWSQDPGGDLDSDGSTDPGDALIAHDTVSDGYGIEATLRTSDSHKVTTRGHGAPYWSPWGTGNLTEGDTYYGDACVVKGTFSSCAAFSVVA